MFGMQWFIDSKMAYPMQELYSQRFNLRKHQIRIILHCHHPKQPEEKEKNNWSLIKAFIICFTIMNPNY
jgi:hypothetical protein